MASLNSDTMSDQCCTRLVFEAVKENSSSKFELAESTYHPLELLTSLVHCNDNGETPLMIVINRKYHIVSYPVMKFLSRECLYLHEESLMTLYLLAIEQIAQQISMVELVEFFFRFSYLFSIDSIDSNINRLEIVVQTLFKSTTLKRQNKITALELIGAILILRDKSNFCRSMLALFGLKFWREAMILRYFPAHGEPLLPKTPDICVPSVASSAVFGSVVEVVTMEEFNLLERDFKQDFLSYNPLLTMLMKVQAFLTLRRICSQANHGQPCSLYLNSLLDFGFDCINGGHFKDCKHHCINTCLIILDEMTGFDPKMLSRESFYSFKKALSLISECFIVMLSHDEREEISYATFLAPTKFISTIAKFYMKPAMISEFSEFSCHWDKIQRKFLNFSELVFRLLLVLESISPQLSSQEQQKLEEYYSIYIQNLFPKGTTTVLHAAVYSIQEHNLRFGNAQQHNIEPIKLILKLGADPNAIDKTGETPLHILAKITFVGSDECLPVFQALVDAGGHLDMATNGGDTVISILKQSLQNLKNRGSIVHPYYESLIKTVFKLSCYCARVIRRNGIRFDEDRLPIHLQEFVTQHSTAQDLIDFP